MLLAGRLSWHARSWSKLAPPPEVRELVDESVWEKECTGEDGAGARQLCFVAFLPDILDSQAAGRCARVCTHTRVCTRANTPARACRA